MDTIHYIYTLHNKITNKYYVGYTSRQNPNTRLKQHIYDAKRPGFKDRPLYRAINKYGAESFEFNVIYCSNDYNHTLEIMEPYFIEKYNSHILDEGYNLTKGGQSNWGWIPSDATKELWSSQRTNRKFTQEHRDKLKKAANEKWKNQPN